LTGSVSVLAWLVGTHFDLFCGMGSLKTGPVVFCWLAKFDVLERKRSRLNVAKMCRSVALVEELGDASGAGESEASVLLGVVKLRIRVVCHSMLKVSPHEHEQILFWESCCEASLHDKAHIFDVLDLFVLPQPVAVQQFSSRRFWGFTNWMESGQAERVIRGLDVRPSWLDAVADVVLRLPTPSAQAVASGRWDSIVLPQVKSKSMFFNFAFFDINAAQIPRLPQANEIVGPKHTVLSSDKCTVIADLLKDYWSLVLGTSAVDACTLRSLECCTNLLHDVGKAMTPESFLKAARIFTGDPFRASDSLDYCKASPFRVTHLINVLLWAQTMRAGSKDLRRVLKLSLKCILPPEVWATLDGCGAHGYINEMVTLSLEKNSLGVATQFGPIAGEFLGAQAPRSLSSKG
jgi:hypothetical protein